MALFGVVLAAILMSRAIKGALIISILTTTVVGMVVGAIPVPQGLGDLTVLILPSIAPTFGKLDLKGALAFGVFNIIFTFTMVELFDNMGTLIGIVKKGQFNGR